MAKPVRFRDKWQIRWFEGGRRRSQLFASWADARDELRRREAAAADAPKGPAQAQAPRTFDAACAYWMTNRAALKRSADDDASIIRKHLLPAFGGRLLGEIGPEQIDAFIVAAGHLAKKTLHNHLTLLISIFNVAVELKWLKQAPKIRKPKVRLFNRDFKWLRTSEEVRRFLTAARAEGEHVFALYAAAALTGLRAGELAGLRWPDVQFDRGLLVVQRSFDGPTKADDVRYVPIDDALLPILKAWRLRGPTEFVFPNQRGGMLRPSARVFQEVLARVLKRGGFPPRYINFHSLRHSYASHFMASGGDLFKLQRILGHKSSAMTERYAHLAPAAFEQDRKRLGSLVPSAGGDVVSLVVNAGH